MSKSKSSYDSAQQTNLLDARSIKPQLFWRKVKDLGATTNKNKSNPLPITLLNSNSSVSVNKMEVLNTWKEYFEKLLNPVSQRSQSPHNQNLEFNLDHNL